MSIKNIFGLGFNQSALESNPEKKKKGFLQSYKKKRKKVDNEMYGQY